MNVKNMTTLLQVSKITGVSIEVLLEEFKILSHEDKRALLRDLKNMIKRSKDPNKNSLLIPDSSKFLFPL